MSTFHRATDPGDWTRRINQNDQQRTDRAGTPYSRATVITADELMRKDFPEPRWAVPGVFPEGLALFVGPPKIGKSWLGLNVSTAVACGGYAIGKIGVDEGDVLYLALEDTQRRLQERLRIVLQGGDAPGRLHFDTQWPTLANGAIEELNGWLSTHPDTRLVVIDTFQKLRGPVSANQNLYASDYETAGELKRLADSHGIAIVCVHHTRKAMADDPLDTVSGSNGLAGAADTICVLRKEIGKADATLYIRGRDVPEADHALSFDPETCTWTLIGDAAEYRVSEERRAILGVLRDADAPMSPKSIGEALGKRPGAVRYLLHAMAKAGEVDGLGGAYRLPPLSTPNTPNTANGQRVSVRDVRGVRESEAQPETPLALTGHPEPTRAAFGPDDAGPNLYHCRRCSGALPDDRDAICPACGDDDDDMREAAWAATSDWRASA